MEGDKDDMRHGRGCQVYNNKDRYDGDWRLNMVHGFGVFTSANGDVYRGQLEQNKKHGTGTFYNKQH